jgi:hypothetical protein
MRVYTFSITVLFFRCVFALNRMFKYNMVHNLTYRTTVLQELVLLKREGQRIKMRGGGRLCKCLRM